MSTDLKVLAWTAALTLFLWLPYILARLMREGVGWLATFVIFLVIVT